MAKQKMSFCVILYRYVLFGISLIPIGKESIYKRQQ